METKNEKDNVRTSYYYRVMSKGLKELLQNGGKFHWLIDFVKNHSDKDGHKDLDFQTRSEVDIKKLDRTTPISENEIKKSWFSVYRGTSSILKICCEVGKTPKIEVADSYQKLDKKVGFYKIKEWGKYSKEDLEKMFNKLIEKINGSEYHGKYYIKNGKKMEGYYQNLVSRRYSIYHKSDDKLLIFDKEFELGYKDEKTRDTICMPEIKKWVYNKKRDVANVFREKSLPICSFLDENGHKKEFNKISTECDFVGINNKGDIVLLEVKRKADEEKLALAPLQVATYYKILKQHIENEGLPKLQQVIFDMIKQKKDLGLINKDYELPETLSGDIQLAIVVGGKNITPDTIEKFKIVKEAVKGCRVPKIDYYTCGEDGSIELVEDLESLKNFDGYDINDDSYKNNEMAWQAKLLCADKDKKKEEQVFDGAKGGGLYDGKAYSHVLQCGKKNLFEWIIDKEKFPQYKSAIDYFDANKITWHKGGVEKIVCNTLSSQIACLNHLFMIKNDHDAVLALLNGVTNEYEDVSPIEYDDASDKGFIAFEVIDKNNNLNERGHRRGSYCTSIDALICAIDKKGSKCLIAIEWKYTEEFTLSNKYSDKRRDTYKKFFDKNSNLKKPEEDDWKNSIYYKEPFYQLMRQTLWAEQMIANKSEEDIQADKYLHLHVIPKDNDEFRKGGETERIWKSMLKDDSKYIVIDPEELLAPIVNDKELSKKYSSLTNYLRTRYWDRPSETTNDNQNPSAK